MKNIHGITSFERQSERAALSGNMLPGERTTGRLAVVNEPMRPAAWEDRVRMRRLSHVGLVAAAAR